MAKYLKPKLKFYKKLELNLEKISNFKKKQNINKKIIIKKNKSDYALQLNEKQKMKRQYGILDKQFKIYFLKSKKKKNSFLNLLNVLEKRLDNILYRSYFTITRQHARQLIVHKLIYVNSKIVNIPSYQVHENDIIHISNKLKDNYLIKKASSLFKKNDFNWIEPDFKNFIIKIISEPNLNNILNDFNEDLIMELYSR